MNIDIPGALFTLSLSIPIFKVKRAPVISMLIEGLPLVGKIDTLVSLLMESTNFSICRSKLSNYLSAHGLLHLRDVIKCQ